MYYLRTKPAANAIQFTVDKTKVNNAITNNTCKNGTNDVENGNNDVTSDLVQNMADMVCSLENKDACLSCGS